MKRGIRDKVRVSKGIGALVRVLLLPTLNLETKF